MSELVERFRYRFQLWRKEQREDWIGPPGTHLPQVGPPGLSGWRLLFRSGGAYLVIVLLLTRVAAILSRAFPDGRFAIFLLLAFVIAFLTLSFVIAVVSGWTPRQDDASKSSNQTMQLTADRTESTPSVHETAFVPKMPPFRQR